MPDPQNFNDRKIAGDPGIDPDEIDGLFGAMDRNAKESRDSRRRDGYQGSGDGDSSFMEEPGFHHGNGDTEGVSAEFLAEFREFMDDSSKHLESINERVRKLQAAFAVVIEHVSGKKGSSEGEGSTEISKNVIEIKKILELLVEEGSEVKFPEVFRYLEEKNIDKIFDALDKKISMVNAASKTYTSSLAQTVNKATMIATAIAVAVSSLISILGIVTLKYIVLN